MESLLQFADNVWIANGPPIRTLGFAFSSRMIAVKLSDGSLWINSPVEATDDEMRSVSQLGPVKHLVAPTPLHVWRLEVWSKRYPDAQCWLPQMLGDEPPAAWAGDLEQLVFRGSRILNEVEFFHPRSRTLIFCDFIQQYSARPGHVFFNLFTKVAGLRDGGVPPDIRWSFARNTAAGRQSLEKLLAWDFDKFIPAHGACIEHDAKPFVREAFRWLVSRPSSQLPA